MRERVQLPIPIWTVQYALMGGHRRMLMFGFGFAGLLIVGAFALRRAMANYPLPTVAGWMLRALAAIQIAIIVLGGCNAVYRALLRDYETKMVESHRLTPISNLTMCLGYLFGSTLQITVLFLVGLLAGVLISIAGSSPIEPFLQGNLLFFSGAVSLWAAVLFSGMRLSKPISPAPFLIGFATLFTAIVLLPGAGLLLAVYSIGLGFWLVGGLGTTPDAAVIIVFLVNLVFTAFWVGVAAVKYRRPDLPALNGWRGLLLLALWLVVSTAGILAFERVRGTSLRQMWDNELAGMQWIATIIISLGIAAIVTICTAECRCLIREGRSPRSRWDRVGDLGVGFFAVALICVVMAVLGQTLWPNLIVDPWGEWARSGEPVREFERAAALRTWGWTLAALVFGMLTARGVFLLVYGTMRVRAAWLVSGIFLGVGWGGPPLVDSFRAHAVTDVYAPSLAYSALFACSPPGTIIAAWARFDIPFTPGLVFQALVALLLTILARTPGKAATDAAPSRPL